MATVQEVNNDLLQMERSSTHTHQMLQRVASALEQQSAAVEEINASITSLDQIATMNAAASEEMASSVMELSRIADATRKRCRRFAADGLSGCCAR